MKKANSAIRIREIKPINIEGGYLIDGFPSVGYTSAIASESMINSSNFEFAGIVDSDEFFPVSIVKQGKPNFPTRIFVNNSLKVAVFLSYNPLVESLLRIMAKAMLQWAKKHKCSLVISSVALESYDSDEPILAVANTEAATKRINLAGLSILEYGTIPGMPGILLNEGLLRHQDVVVLIFNSADSNPDFKSSAQLCQAMSRLVPGTSCDISLLQKEAELAEQKIKSVKVADALKAMYG